MSINRISEEQFAKGTYKELTLVKEQKNGVKIYIYKGTCAKCGGTGHLTWTSVDNGVCYCCEGTGKVLVKIAVVPNDLWEKEQKESVSKARKMLNERKQKNIELGYKERDLDFTEWWKKQFNNSTEFQWKYYRIIAETEKAYQISFLMELELCDFREWIPKSAIIWNKKEEK